MSSRRFDADKIISKKLKQYLGSSKCTIEYMRSMRSSVDRFNEREIPGLYALIIPSGGGKSTAAKEWGFLDIDNIIGNQEAMEKLVLARREMIRWGTNKWEEHNREWYDMVHSVLSRYNFEEKPNVILVHTEEMAFEVGATPLAALIPSKGLHNARLGNRNELERILAVDNLRIVENRTKSVDVYTYNTWQELEQYLACLVWDVMEIPAPFRAFKKKPENGWPAGYGEDVPMWVMQGRISDDVDIKVVEKLFDEGAIPGICLSYYTEKMYGIKRLESEGLRDGSMWIDICCEINDCGNMGEIGYQEVMNGDLNEIYPYESKMAMNKRSVGLRRLMENVDTSRNDIMKEVLMKRKGSNQNLVTSIIIWVGGVLVGLRPEIQEAVLKSGVLLIPDDNWIDMCKQVHDLVRTTRQFFGVKVNAQETQRLMYMHMLYGRFTYDVDEDSEIEKRERELDGTKMAYCGGEWSSEEYDKLEVEGIRDAYRRLCDGVAYTRIGEFVEFWKRRRSWAAKGSTVIYEGEKKYIIQIVDKVVHELELRHNKKSLFEDGTETMKILNSVIEGVGRNDSKIVPKYESAAKRALLPGNLYHYIVFSYVLWAFEAGVAVGDVRLGNVRDESFHAFDDKLETGLTRFTYDFSDFNAQHSRKSMARVISLLGECVDPVDSMKFCLKWLSISFGKMELVKKDGTKKPVKSGMYSGWRGTTWINSVLNHAYMYVARICYNRINGVDPFVEYEGAGDDVDGVVKDISVAGKLYAITLRMGLESNVTKQLFGKRAEFLRVTYERGYAGASICRALGNFVSGNWEGEGGTVSEKMSAAIENIMSMGRRGLEEIMVRILYRCILGHMGRIFEGEEWLPISPCILHGRIEDNGFGIPDADGFIYELESKAPAPEGWLGYIRMPARSASEDWVDIIEDEVREKGYKIKDRDRLVEMLARDSYDIKSVADRFGTQISPEEWKRYWRFKCEVVKKWSVETTETDEGLLMEFLEWLGSEETPVLDKLESLSVIGRYSEMMVRENGEQLRSEDWYGELYDAHCRVEAFVARRWTPVRCPPVVQSKIAKWCKEMLSTGELTVFSANYIFKVIGNTYAKLFPMEI
ncbi:putative RNA-dependent RNA polymerase [Persea americana chrysovirus]|uniref:RNA-directed RNA polymerase n=1 Tax=Persea americana chrysovirus TaxID=1587509 RepID=A0A139Z7P7_9VIRU|nr:putative RNA-dependent RNA polymerase [Persea americana chrysovirus]AJA37498.1 putative RNA-dependent RNA polymerase [Persea americana chrysovirus]|eukprot:TRINITY_DN31027_c0_g1_i1.p1 TRINITY_DN31027_c0_g1~~TRINITY_DN31027_c0_g1_i1.p1  ORF type:complete len:1094 (-),score=147.90 TRINITY_DN31027_c0_g1_i1:33-3314(-)